MRGFLGATAVLILVTAAAGPVAAQEAAVAVKVNGVGISRAEFDRSWKSFLAQSGVPPTHADKMGRVDELRQRVIDRLVDQELLHQDAQKRALLPDAAKVEAEFTGIRERFPTPEAFAETLAKSGMDEAALRAFVAHSLAIQRLVEEQIGAGVSLSDAEVHDFYLANTEKFSSPEQVRARHILVKVEETADQGAKDTARARAEELLRQVKGGADFAETAKKHSECPSAAQGGDLGFFGHGQMVAPFEEAAFALKAGETSGIVTTPFGYHIVRVEERREAGQVAEKDAAPRIRDHLRAVKVGEAVEERLRSLRGKAVVEVLLQP